MKLAAIEAMWETHQAPAPFTAFGFPTRRRAKPIMPSTSPGSMGLIGTRSLTEIPGINELWCSEAEERIRSGIIAYDALMTIRESARRRPPTVRATFEEHPPISALPSCCCATSTIRAGDAEQIAQAAEDTFPTSGRCSGRSASWWRSASPSSR
jgi:cytochrome d ubiquinol oxidase subunit I